LSPDLEEQGGHRDEQEHEGEASHHVAVSQGARGAGGAGALGGGPPGGSHHAIGSPGARAVAGAQGGGGGGPPGGASHHAAKSRGGREAPGAGHCGLVDADREGSPGGAGRASWPGHQACPMASSPGQKLEEQAASSPGRRAPCCVCSLSRARRAPLKNTGSRPDPAKYKPN
jgi:hypothetical protein